MDTSKLHPLEALLLLYRKTHKNWMKRFERSDMNEHPPYKNRYERYVSTIKALEEAVKNLEPKKDIK
jgi:hypothetical protein